MIEPDLLSLAGLCVALGLFGHPIVRTVAEPAAGSVNDYAMLVTGGAALCAFVMLS